MAFTKKTWTDRVSEQPQRRLLTPTDGGTAMTVDVTRQEGMVIQEGDAFSAANMNNLETRIKNTFDSDEATITTINNRSNTNASNITTLQTNLNSVSARVTTNTNNINSVSTRVGTIEGELTANGKRIYMDYKNGKYGYNLSANRGADTFFPFSNAELKSVYTGSFHVAHWSPATVYTTTKKYKYLFVFFNNNPQAYITVHFTISAGTEYYQYNYYYYAHSFAIFQNVPSGAKITATSSGAAEKEVTMEGNIWGIED